MRSSGLNWLILENKRGDFIEPLNSNTEKRPCVLKFQTVLEPNKVKISFRVCENKDVLLKLYHLVHLLIQNSLNISCQPTRADAVVCFAVVLCLASHNVIVFPLWWTKSKTVSYYSTIGLKPGMKTALNIKVITQNARIRTVKLGLKISFNF